MRALLVVAVLLAACGNPDEGAVLAKTIRSTQSLTSDGTTLFYLDTREKSVMSVPIAGNGPPAPIVTGLKDPGDAIVASGGNLTFIDSSALSFQHEVKRVPAAGGMPTVLDSGDIGDHTLAVGGTGAYYVKGASQIWRATTGTPSIFYAAPKGVTAVSLCEMRDLLYFVSDDTLWSLPLSRVAQPTALKRGIGSTYNVLAGENDVCWGERGGVRCLPKSGGAVAELNDGDTTFWGNRLAFDGATVFWANSTGVWRAPAAGGTPQLTSSSIAEGLVVVGQRAYWTTGTELRSIDKLHNATPRATQQDCGSYGSQYRGTFTFHCDDDGHSESFTVTLGLKCNLATSDTVLLDVTDVTTTLPSLGCATRCTPAEPTVSNATFPKALPYSGMGGSSAIGFFVRFPDVLTTKPYLNSVGGMSVSADGSSITSPPGSTIAHFAGTVQCQMTTDGRVHFMDSALGADWSLTRTSP